MKVGSTLRHGTGLGSTPFPRLPAAPNMVEHEDSAVKDIGIAT